LGKLKNKSEFFFFFGKTIFLYKDEDHILTY
jgi:hypothetical protein